MRNPTIQQSLAVCTAAGLLLANGCSNRSSHAPPPSASPARKVESQPAAGAVQPPTTALLEWNRDAKDAAFSEVGLADPPEILDPPWLDQRAAAQRMTVPEFGVFCQFGFRDRRPESGITFVNRAVEDAGKRFKAVHYDHGNGVAVADVDADGLLDIYFSTQVGSNQLWHNLGGGNFEDWTERSGVAVADRIGVSASFADTDNDGDADLYVTTVRGGNLLFENDGTGRFRDVSSSSGLDYVGHSSSAVFFDYDRDGLLDLFLTNVGSYTTDEIGPDNYYVGQLAAFGNHLKPQFYEQSILFRNLGQNRFVDASEEARLIDVGWTGDAHPLDRNEDGWPDLYVLSMQGHDEYYENDGGERFVRKSRDIFPATPWGAMGIGVFDFNNDSYMDILITDMHTDMFDTSPFRRYLPGQEKQKLAVAARPPVHFLATDGNHIFGNAFFQNDGNGRFNEVSDRVFAENYWPWGVSVGDLNADGFQDVFITASMNYTFRYAVNSVLLNDRGERFRDSEFILNVEPRRDRRTAKVWFQLDCDGSDRDHPLCQDRTGKLAVWGAVGSRSSVIFDLDNDGDLDVVTNDFHSEPQVLVSDLTERTSIRFLKLTLVGTRSNRDGLGARVTVITNSQTLTQVQDGKSGYLAQSRKSLYFGLADAATVERIDVQWPSGARQTFEGPINVNSHLELRESEAGSTMTKGPSDNVLSRSSIAAGSGSDRPEEYPVRDGAYHVHPGQQIQPAIELAADDPSIKTVRLHAGTYCPTAIGHALIHFNRRHNGITVECVGDVTLTAANPDVADDSDPGYPAIVNHVVYFGDGVSHDTVLRGCRISGAGGFLAPVELAGQIEPESEEPALQKGLFFYRDGGAIKVFGRSYPAIEQVVAVGNSTTLCGGAVSIEHRGFNQQSVLIRDCQFIENRCPATGSAVDVLPGSAAVIENCLFVGNISNTGMDQVRRQFGLAHKQEHGCGALTVFEGSRVHVQRCTFTGNWNGVDDLGDGNTYRACIFWQNTVGDRSRPGPPYEIDIMDGRNVTECYLHGIVDDLRGTVSTSTNVLAAPHPQFDSAYRPANPEYADVGYRPLAPSEPVPTQAW